jgi:hypothetical protein
MEYWKGQKRQTHYSNTPLLQLVSLPLKINRHDRSVQSHVVLEPVCA